MVCLFLLHVCCIRCCFTPFLARSRDTAGSCSLDSDRKPTKGQVRGKQHPIYEPITNANRRVVALPPTRQTGIGGYPIQTLSFAFILSEQLRYYIPVLPSQVATIKIFIVVRELNLVTKSKE